MSKIPIGLQLYSVRHDLAQDVPGTLKAVAEMGYTGVEFFGMPQHEASYLKGILDEVGLVCCGWHTPYTLMQDDKLADTIAFNKTLDNNKLIVPSMPQELRATKAGWLKLAEEFNQIAEKLKPHGMVTGYHNHHIEFMDLEGELPWDTFFGNTNPEVVMQLDNGNALSSGIQVDMADFVRKYPGRGLSIHIKPYTGSLATADDRHAAFQPIIGEDEIDWDNFFDACETVGGTEWYIVEYESDAYPPLEAVDRCLQALRKMGK